MEMCSRDQGQRRQRRRLLNESWPRRAHQTLQLGRLCSRQPKLSSSEENGRDVCNEDYFGANTVATATATTKMKRSLNCESPVQGYNFGRPNRTEELLSPSPSVANQRQQAVQSDLNLSENLVRPSPSLGRKKQLATQTSANNMSPRGRQRRRDLEAPTRALLCLLATTYFCCLLLTSQPAAQISCQTFEGSLAAEGRGADSAAAASLKPPQAIALDQLVKLMNSYANLNQNQQQQQPNILNIGQQQQGQRRPALPLNSAAAIQRGAAVGPQIQVSTPVNPFSLPQFQSSRRVNFPNQMNANNNNNMNNQQQQQQQQPSMFVSSSPPTPYLTLNRIASLANQNGQQNQNQNGQQMRPFQMQPLNTIPLGSLANQQQQQQRNRGAMLPSPPQLRPGGQQQQPQQQRPSLQQPQQQQQQQPFLNNQRQPTFSTPIPLPPSLLGHQANGGGGVKPISGFAPSGPPPSLAASNAMVVVESPTNAIGQTVTAPSTQPAASEQTNRGQQETSTGRPAGEQADQESSSSSSSSSPSSPPTTSVASGQQQEDGSKTTLEPPITLIASSQRPAELPPTTAAAAAAAAATTTTTTTASTVPSSSPPSSTQPTSGEPDQEAAKEVGAQWNPVELNRTAGHSADGQPGAGGPNSRSRVTLLPSPDIVTVPPGYNPDSQANQPQSYDIAVSAQMPGAGANSRPRPSNMLPQPPPPPPTTTTTTTTAPTVAGADGGSSSSSSSADSLPTATEPTGAGERQQQQPMANGGRARTDHLGADSAPAASTVLADGGLQSTPSLPPVAPTAVTTIIWSPSEGLSTGSMAGSNRPMLATASSGSGRPPVQPTRVALANSQATLMNSHLPTARIRDNSMINSQQQDEPQHQPAQQQKQPKFGDKQPPVQADSSAAGVVYGKAPAREAKPTPPNNFGLVSPAPTLLGQASFESQLPGAGRPFIQPVQMDNQVRPYSAGAQPQQQQQQSPPAILKSNHHGHSASSSSVPLLRSSKPLGSQSAGANLVGSAFTITGSGNQTMPTGDIQDYVAGQPPLLASSSASSAGGQQAATGGFHVTGDEPTISAAGGPNPSLGHEPSAAHSTGPNGKIGGNSNSNNNGSSSDSAGGHLATPRIRRPTFKPKPAVPPIRIDSCIVGDESSCDQSHNERCVTEYGISSCHCKPGFARLSQLRGYCSPISSLQLSMKIDRLSDDRRLVYNQTLDNSNTEEYQYLEFETIQALASAFQQTSLAKQFMGARVNKFFERRGKVYANLTVNFEANEISKTDKILTIASQELQKVVQGRAQKPLGDSTVVLDNSKETISRLVDVNECSSRELNDCSKFASCTNDFGGFRCQCLPGYEDKHQKEEDLDKHGRVCLGCSPSFCSNRGECSIIDGQKQCKCRPNFIGTRCDIDSEVLAVAVGGSLVGIVILVITFWCLYVFNRRWKREQQKMDAMSATSGLTFNYVNSSTNSLMSPTSARIVGGLHGRSGANGGHQVGAIASNYGQRFGAALVNGTNRVGYANDQQAIIGSTSSGSSAASQPIACNPYATNQYQYEDAGLLIAPASTGSSEQTSPSGQSYRGLTMAGNAYTLSGHHHHHHHHPGNLLHSHKQQVQPQITQFHPAADFRAMQQQQQQQQHCNTATNTAAFDHRWRTLQQQDYSKQQQTSTLIGYYLSPEMLVNQQQQNQIQQLYASPQRELCIDTSGNNRARKQPGRANQTAAYGQTMRSRSQSQHNLARNSMYHNPSDYDHERPI